MKVFLFCVLVGILQVNAAILTREQDEKLEAYHKICLKQPNVNEVLIENVIKGIYNGDPSFKNYVFCFSQRIGFQDVNGTVQKDVFRKKLGIVVEDQEVLSRLVEQCTVQKENPEDTAFNIAKCLCQHAFEIPFFKVTKTIVYLPNEEAEKYLAQHKECAAENNVDEELIRKLGKEGRSLNGDNILNYILCMVKRQGTLNDDGTINKDKYYDSFKDVIDDVSVIDQLAQKCLVQQDTPINTALFISKCTSENSLVSAEVFPREIPVPDDIASKIFQYSKECLAETGVDIELVYKLRDGIYSDDPKLKEFLFCMSKKSGFLNDDGDFQIEVIREKGLKLYKDPVVVQKLIDLCAVKQETPQETSFYTYICLNKKSPGHFGYMKVIPKIVYLPNEQTEKFLSQHKECAAENNLDETVIRKFHKEGKLYEDDTFKDYIFCMTKRQGVLSEDGTIHKEKFYDCFKQIIDDVSVIEKLYQKCVIPQYIPKDIAFFMSKCIYGNSPVHAEVFPREIPLPDDMARKIFEYCKECLAETGVDIELVFKLRDGIYSDDSKLKEFLFCMLKKSGFLNDDGDFQIEVIREKSLKLFKDPVVVQKLIDQCAVKRETPQETAFYTYICVKNKAPGHFSYMKVSPEIVYLPNEQAEKFLANHKECAAENNLDEEVIRKARKEGKLYEDDRFKDYIFCMTKKQRVLSDDGIIIKDKFYECFEHIIGDASVREKLAQKCLVQQDTPKDTAFFVSKCIYENSPVYVEIFPREIPIPDDMAEKMIKYYKECLAETSVDKKLVHQMRDSVYSDDPKLKEFLVCIWKKAGFINNDGDFQIEVIRKINLRLFKDPLVVQKLIDRCTLKRETLQETVFHSHICFKKNAPGRLSYMQLGALLEGQNEKRRQVIKECSEETKVSIGAVLSARKGDFRDDPLLKEYLFCVNKKCGAINEKGEFNHDFIRKSLTEMFNAERAEKIMEKCLKTQDTPINTSFEAFRCFYTNTPEAANKDIF